MTLQQHRIMNSEFYTVVKLFDCSKMPSDVKKEFFAYHEKHDNDIIVEHIVYDSCKSCTITEFQSSFIDESKIIDKDVRNGRVFYNKLGDDIISDWLFQLGADIGETVCIYHHW